MAATKWRGSWPRTTAAPRGSVWGINLEGPWDAGVLPNSGGVWRQYVVSLAQFAGQSNIRLRFDFTTNTKWEVGNTPTTGLNLTGSYLTALAGNQIDDGSQFTIGGQVFEFDMGDSLTIPNQAGLAIPNGEQFTVQDSNGQSKTFEIDQEGDQQENLWQRRS